MSIIRKIVKVSGNGGKVAYYFPPKDFNTFNKYDLDEQGYLPDGTICEMCLLKGGEKSVCEIDVHYMDIIYQLQDAGLLPQDYLLMCCDCFEKSKASGK